MNSGSLNLVGKRIWVIGRGDGSEGGVQRYGWEVTAAYERNGAIVTLFSSHKHGVVEVAHCSHPGRFSHASRFPSMMLWLVARAYLLDRSVDLIHITSWRCLRGIVQFLPLLIPSLLTVHGRDIYYSKQLGRRSPLWRALPRIRRVVAVSRFTKSYFETEYPEFQGKCVWSHNGALSALVSRLHSKNFSSELIFFTVCRHVARKNLLAAIEAFDLLLRKFQQRGDSSAGVCFVIAGVGPDTNEIKAKIKALGLEHRISLVGGIGDDELLSWYERAHVFVHPQLAFLSNGDFEGFGLGIADAMVAGLVPIVGANAGPEELIEHGVTGLLVDSEDADNIASAMERIAFDRVEAAVMAKNAMAVARQRYTWTRHLSRALGDVV